MKSDTISWVGVEVREASEKTKHMSEIKPGIPGREKRNAKAWWKIMVISQGTVRK